MRIYLDVCSLNRPFDNRGIARNALEAEAIIFILRRVAEGDWTLCDSAALSLENSLCPFPDRRQAVAAILAASTFRIDATESVVARMRWLVSAGLKDLDALHLASAEAAICDVFLTTDDRLMRRAQALKVAGMRVENPLTFVTEHMKHG